MKQQQLVISFRGTDYCMRHAIQNDMHGLWEAASKQPQMVLTMKRVGTCDLCEDVLTPDDAWTQVQVLAGMYARNYEMPTEREASLNKKARHEMYRILGAAKVNCNSQEVKDRLWAIQEVAKQMELNWYEDNAYHLDDAW